MAGPTLAGVVGRAEALIGSPDYKGSAQEPLDYIRESIVSPNSHLVPGDMYSANGQSFMPNTYAQALTPEQIDQLAQFLATLR